MAGASIKLFQFNQKFCQTMGIKLSRSNKNRYVFEHVIFVIFETLFAITLVAFLLYDAESMGEYGATFFTLITIMLAFVIYFVMVWKIQNIMKFTENCERFIEKSIYCVVMTESLSLSLPFQT